MKVIYFFPINKVLKVFIFLFLILMLALTACVNETTKVNEGNAQLQETEQLTSENLTEQYRRFFDDVANTGILTASWDVAKEIDPMFLVNFFGTRTQLSRISSDSDPLFVPAYIVEDFIRSYFDVDIDHIRQARYYDSDKNGYYLPLMSSSNLFFKIVNVSEDDSTVTLFFEFYGYEDTVVRAGELQIYKTDINDPYMHYYKYISSKVEEFSN